MSSQSKTEKAPTQTFEQKVQALSEIGFDLAHTDSLDKFYKKAIILGRTRLGFDRLSLLLYDAESNTMAGTFGTNGQGQVRDERYFRQEIENPEILEILSQKQRYKVWEDTQLIDEGKEIGQGWNIMTVLWDGTQGVGWLAADNLLTQKPLEQQDIDILILYSTYLGQIIALKRNELALQQSKNEIQAKADSLSIINRIADTLYRSHALDDVVQQAANFILEYTKAPTIAIFSLDEKAENLHLLASRGFTSETLAVGSILPVKGSLSGLAITQGTIVSSDDILVDQRMATNVQKMLLAQNLKTAVSIPMVFQNTTWGVINLLFDTALNLAQQEKETLLTIGKTIGLALNNAQRVAQIENEIHTKEILEKQNQEALEIRSRQVEIGQAIANAQTETDVITTIIEKSVIYPQTAISLFLREASDDQTTYILINRNANASNLKPLPVGTRLQSSEIPELLETSEPIIIPNVTNTAILGKKAQNMARRIGIVSWAAFPLISAGEKLGVLMAASAEENYFQENRNIIFQTIAEQGASAIRAARLFQATQETLKRRGEEVALATQIAQEIAAATDLGDLYQRVVTQIHELFGYYHTQLLRYDNALDTVALVYGYGKVGQEMLELNHSIPMNVGIIGTAAAAGKSILRPNLYADESWQPNPLLPHTKGELAVPIKLRNEVLGVLDVQSDKVDKLDENDLLLLEGLCGQIAVAIESTRLRQEMEANLRELTTLQRYMSREAWQAYKQSRQNIAGYQFDQTGVTPLAKESTLASNENGKGENLIAAHLQVRGEAFGTIGIFDNPAQPLTEEELTLLQSITEQVSEALEAARLFEQTQDALFEQERLASELETVAQVTTAASTILEVDNLLQAVVDLAKTSFDLYHTHVYMIEDDDQETLTLKAGAGNIGRLMTLEGREIHIDAESIVARAARTRDVVIENDVLKVVDFLPHPLLPKTKAEMAVPMIVGNQLIGVLDLQAEQIGRFTEEDVKIQRTLATQVAVAVENAKLYAEQVQTTEKLRQVDQLKSEFLASMSHELRTPLNSIIGFADVLLEGLDGELNERMEQDVKLIRNSGAHLRELIGDILDMSKIEAGRMELRYEMFDIRDLVNDIVATAMPLAQEKNLELFAQIADDVEMIEADRTRIRQIMWNITGNAIKFTEKGSVTLSLETRDTSLLVGIHDTGIGIRPEDIPIVFEQFRQIDGSLNRRAGGTGLGMPITKNLVELHGGKIWIESGLGQGTTFWFTIPLAQELADRPKTGPLPELNARYG